MALEFAKTIRSIRAYPVADSYDGSEPLVRLASNESPEAPLPEVIAAVEAVLGGLNRYPDPSNGRLRRALADRYAVPAERIAVGNGSCDILLAAGQALLEDGAELVYAWPSFSVYPQLGAASGARAIEVPLDGDECHDLTAMLDEITAATRLVIVCNPNNPTSTAVPIDRIAEFLEQVPPRVCVILDEAYCEFNVLQDPDVTLGLLARHPNLVLLRTFSKVYGLCGLRVGFALCGSRELPDALSQVRQPFFCNAAAQAAATEALRHQDAVSRRVERAIVARGEFERRLRALGIRPAPSQANFCWFELPIDENDAIRGLTQRGVLVRAGSALGKPGALRVTYGSPAENEAFFGALEAVLASTPAGSSATH